MPQHGSAIRCTPHRPPRGADKYAKLVSTAFGFSVPAGTSQLDQAADSMLALSDDDETHWRVRESCVDTQLEEFPPGADGHPVPVLLVALEPDAGRGGRDLAGAVVALAR